MRGINCLFQIEVTLCHFQPIRTLQTRFETSKQKHACGTLLISQKSLRWILPQWMFRNGWGRGMLLVLLGEG